MVVIETPKGSPNKLTFEPSYGTFVHRSIQTLSDLSPDLVAQIEHFFVSYNEMKGKRFNKAPAGQKRALTLLTAAIRSEPDDRRKGGRWRSTASLHRRT